MNAVVAESGDPYADVWRERAERLKWLREEPTRFEGLRRYYRAHIADYINDWGTTQDPRNVGTDLPVLMPFVLDKRQREWLEFTETNWRDGKYGGTEKSRDVGCSWLAVAFAISLCELYDGTVAGLGSYIQDKVDRSGDMGSLFEKARAYLDGQPQEFRTGYDRATHSRERRLLFPETGSAIIGEIGDNIGRGGRTSLYFVDEAAYLEHDQMVDAALSKNTNCRQDISSVRGMGNTFAQRMHDGKSRKFTFHWRENPRFTQAMYDAFLEQWGPVITAQELDINYLASQEGTIIPAEWVSAAIDAHIELGIEASGVVTGAFDVADRGIDKNAFAARHGCLLFECVEWSGRGSDIFESVERVFQLCDEHELTQFRYDGDGVGAGVRGDARVINERRREQGLGLVDDQAYQGSAAVIDPDGEMVPGRTNRDFFANFKAQSWWALRARFQLTYRAVKERAEFDPDEIISISSKIGQLPQLVRELSQPTYSINGAGKVLVDKAPKGLRSPNLADGTCMAYAPTVSGSFFPESALLA